MARILIVEDEESFSDALSYLLEKEGFEVTVAADGNEALSVFERDSADLILLDLNLPRMDGREVLQALKSDDELRKIPVVVLTTSEAEEDVIRSYSLHANAYVTKPVDFDRFIDVVRQIDEFFVEEFGGILVTDFWAAYDAVGRTKQKCWPHLLRDLKEVDAGSDNGGDWGAFAKRLRRIYGDAVRFELAVALEDGDQRKVAGTAADVDHQDDVARCDLLAPAAAAALDPAVQRRLRLFEQGRREAGQARGVQRQLARARIE